MISTRRRVEYALGYIALGMFKDASAELAAVQLEDQGSPTVLGARIALHQEADEWGAVEELARRLIELDDTDAGAWISLGCAVRRTKGFAAARDLLLAVEPRIGATCATLHYNLACYHCLLGELAEARERLARACRMDTEFQQAAKVDPDLERLKDELASLAE